MAVSGLFKQAALGGLALATIGGLSSLGLFAEDNSDQTLVEVYQVADLPVWRLVPDAAPKYDGTVLVAHIRAVTGLEQNGDKGSIVEVAETASLAIRQTRAKHQQTSDLLERLREKQTPKEATASLVEPSERKR